MYWYIVVVKTRELIICLANWDKCVEVRKCEENENPWGNDCFSSNSHPAGPNTIHTNVEYPDFGGDSTGRHMTNTAVWIVVNDGAEFDHTETELDGRCINGLPDDQHFCWTMIRRGRLEYKFNRGSNFANTQLDMISLGMRNKYTTETLPSSVVAERMVLCDGDVHSFPSDPVAKPECCDSLIQSRLGDEWGQQVAWSKTSMTNRGQAIYQNADGDFLTVAKIDVNEEWIVSSKPVPTSYSDVKLLSSQSDKCPDQIFRNWSDQKSIFSCNPCDKRIRPCQAWDDPASTDCYVWESEYTGDNEDHSYRGTLTYPFLGQTKYYQANKSVWINFEHNIHRNDLTVQSECEMDQNEFCWIRNKNGPKFFQFTRGQDARQAKLDFVGITVDVQLQTELLGHDLALDAVYICESNQHSPPLHDADKHPDWHLIPEDPAPEPPTCSIDNIDDATMDVNDLIAGGMKTGKATRVVKFWADNVIGKFKELYARSQYDSCKYDGEFFCHNLSLPSDDHREIYDWALALFAERLGACGGYRQLDKKLQRWAKMVNIAEPVLEGTDCPRKCHHTSFHQYLLPRIDFAIENSGFTKKSHKMKFKYFYTKWMSIIQNEYRESEQCQASVGSQDTFDCLTVCVATDADRLMSFYFARLGDSILSKFLVLFLSQSLVLNYVK